MNCRPYTSPMWMGIRGEVSEYIAAKGIRAKASCCDLSGMERKARKYVKKLESESNVALAEYSLARCIRRMAHVFCAKGGCDNTRAERVISIMLY